MRRAAAAIVIAATFVVAALGCDTGEGRRAGTGPEKAPREEGVVATGTFRPVRGAQSDEFAAGRWTEIPPSPVGDRWPNRFALVDGSGWVDAGVGAVPSSADDISREIAYFSIAERRWLQLPDLPLVAGLGATPSGIRVGDVLVVAGVDCPASVGGSMAGAEYCAPGGASAKVVITYDLTTGVWRRLAVPDDLVDYREASPRIVGVHDGRVVIVGDRNASPDRPAARFRVAELDVTASEWTSLPEPPGLDGAVRAQLCVVDGVVVQVTSASWQSPGPPAVSRFADGVWSASTVVGDLPAGEAFCAASGIYVQEGPTTPMGVIEIRRIRFVRLDGSSTEVGATPQQIQMPLVSGDLMAVPPTSFSSDQPTPVVEVYLPTGRVPADRLPAEFPYGVRPAGLLLVDDGAGRVTLVG